MWRFILATVALCGVANAQGLTPEARQELLDYKLTMARASQLITALPEMTRFINSLPKDQLAKAVKASPAELAAIFANNPTSAAILKRNGLTAKEYLVGVPALRMAVMAAQGQQAPNLIASPANVAFAKANLADLKRRFEVADGGAQTK